ncbi:1,4-dihydroxy-2-naphthoate octaprenyltransferase [Colwellia sp. MB02u-9]|uniref:1,4-dihydroxy-2-naphthoate octaprenyltransferase n=1 Tax=Colwellia sp. MB02u-9 TaxID=2759823 RepID=UPI001C70AFC6|nr:1,4-dihydroxy-2-naphthoate octaprenyltransferase [Colwellia sp. MB02u-9]
MLIKSPLKSQLKSQIKYWWLAIRPRTLLASMGPILLGTALATREVDINKGIFFSALVCAMSLQIAVNLANDLFDSLSGVDNEQRVGPVRVVQADLISLSAIKLGLALTCTVAMLSGLYLVVEGGWWILALGVLSFLGVFTYSAGPFPLASNALGEVTVLIFFGWVAVLGSYYLQTGSLSLLAFGLATSAGLYSSAIMLVNNIRDIATDQAVKKYTLAVILGEHKARMLLAMLITAALIIHAIFAIQVSFILWLTTILLVAPSYYVIKKGFTLQGSALNSLLANVAQVGFLYCFSVALSVMIFL